MGQKAQRILTLIEDGDLVESLDFVLRAVEDAVRIADEQALAAAAREAQAERQEFDRQPTIDSVFDALHELPDELQTIVDASSPDTRFDEDITSVRAKLQSLQTEDEVAEQGPPSRDDGVGGKNVPPCRRRGGGALPARRRGEFARIDCL